MMGGHHWKGRLTTFKDELPFYLNVQFSYMGPYGVTIRTVRGW